LGACRKLTNFQPARKHGGLSFVRMKITVTRDEVQRIVTDYFKQNHPSIIQPEAFLFVNDEDIPECEVNDNPIIYGSGNICGPSVG
jgi:hypothetical protein